MRVFNPRMSEKAAAFLLIHAGLLILYGVLVQDMSLDCLRHPLEASSWRILPALYGSLAALGAGVVVAALCAFRLTRPFDETPGPGICLTPFFGRLFLAEALIFFIPGPALALGEDAAWRLLLLTFAANFLLLILFGGNPKKKPA